MASRGYETQDGTTITGPYTYGTVVDIPGVFSGRLNGPFPSLGIYDATEDNTQCEPPAYYVRQVATAFVGTLNDPAARVQETVNCQQIPIDDLYDLKRIDIANYDDEVRYNAVDTSLSANWWVIVTRDLRFELDGIQGSWLQRQQDSLAFPSGPNAPWVGIYNAGNQRIRRYQVSEAQWRTIYDEKTAHDQACGNATDASVSALDAAYDDGNGNWQDVADHDPQDPAWGYPPTVQISDLAQQIFG